MTPDVAQKITVYLIDDESIVRAGLRALLERCGVCEVVGETDDPRAGIREIGRQHPDVAIVDIAMPGLSGLDAIGPIKRASSGTRVLIASQHEAEGLVQRALQAGADGYLSKSSDPGELRIAVESIHRGESFVSPRVVGTLIGWLHGSRTSTGQTSSIDQLTPREREVFQLVAIGKANKEIAMTLHVSLGTVKKHRENLQRKLDCHSAAQLARLAIREGLVCP